MKFINNPLTLRINSKPEPSEDLINYTNLIDPILKSKEQEAQPIGNQFYKQLNQKIKVIEDHHIRLNKQLPNAPFSIILQNQKQTTKTEIRPLNSYFPHENNLINIYPYQINLSVYKTISSLFKFDPLLKKQQYIIYTFNKTQKTSTFPSLVATNILDLTFLSMGYLISKPQFKKTPTSIKIQIFYYKQSRKFSKLIKTKLKYLMIYLIKLFNSPIELEITRLYQAHNESTILVKSLVNKTYKSRFLKIISTLFKRIKFEEKSHIHTFTTSQYESVPSFVSGIKIRLGGRTIRQRIVPRKTVQYLQKGTLARTKTQYIEKAQVSHKTKKGAFTFTVHIGHTF